MISSIVEPEQEQEPESEDIPMSQSTETPKEESDKTENLNSSLNSSNRTLEDQDTSHNESFELNMSSVSNTSVNQKSKQTSNEPEQKLILPEDPTPRTLSRTNSELSLFSQISSVSEHYEKVKKQEQEEEKANAQLKEELQ